MNDRKVAHAFNDLRTNHSRSWLVVFVGSCSTVFPKEICYQEIPTAITTLGFTVFTVVLKYLLLMYEYLPQPTLSLFLRISLSLCNTHSLASFFVSIYQFALQQLISTTE